MPQEAYDDFAKLLKRLNDSDLTFDMYNPNNILVDVKNKKFNIVDDLRAIVDDKDKDSFASIAIPLFDTWYVGTLARVDDYVEVWQDVIKKSKVAATKAGLQPPKKNLFWVKKMHELADLKSYKEGS